jgi:hypothetical protein
VAGLGELYAALVTIKEFDTQALLQLSNLPAERRLCNVQAVRRLVKVEILRDGDEVSNVSELHGEALYIGCTASPGAIFLTDTR